MTEDKKRILMVEDEYPIRILIRQMIEDKYNIVGEAVSGEEALDKYKELRPDLVLMDLMMRGINGVEASRNIIDFDSSAKIIAVTAVDDREYVVNAIKVGMCGYLVKPIEEKQLIEAMENALAGKTNN